MFTPKIKLIYLLVGLWFGTLGFGLLWVIVETGMLSRALAENRAATARVVRVKKPPVNPCVESYLRLADAEAETRRLISNWEWSAYKGSKSQNSDVDALAHGPNLEMWRADVARNCNER